MASGREGGMEVRRHRRRTGRTERGIIHNNEGPRREAPNKDTSAIWAKRRKGVVGGDPKGTGFLSGLPVVLTCGEILVRVGSK